MLLELDVDEQQRRHLTPVVYLGDAEGGEMLANLEAWFPVSFMQRSGLGPQLRGAGGLAAARPRARLSRERSVRLWQGKTAAKPW